MKKICVTLLMAVAMALPSQAQVNFGLKGGLNLTSMSLNQSDLESAISNKSGFFIGPTVKFTLPIVNLGMDASVLYDQREAEIKSTGEKLKQKSIQIPINARFGLGLGDLANVFIFVGPQFGFNVGGDTEKQSIKDWSLKTANISGNAGLGFMFVNHLQISVNYNFALSNSAECKVYKLNSDAAESVKVKNNAWQIALAYYF